MLIIMIIIIVFSAVLLRETPMARVQSKSEHAVRSRFKCHNGKVSLTPCPTLIIQNCLKRWLLLMKI